MPRTCSKPVGRPSPLKCHAMKLYGLYGMVVLPLALTQAMPARADSAAMQRCRIIAEAAARLACYDAIALPGIGSRTGWGAPVAATSAPGIPAATGSATGTATGAAVTSSASADRPGPEQTFGLENRQREGALDVLSSRIAGKVTQFQSGTRFTLDNGQIWQIVDNTSGVYELESPPVRIERALLGSFLMTIEGVNQRPRVRRIR